MDPYEKLNLTKNSDGSVNRPNDIPASLPCDSLDDDNILALSKDVTLNAANNTWLRLYLPKPPPTDDDNNNKKLPIIIYFHGGGLVLYSAATTPIHDLSIFRATNIPALIVSVEYRLAPEHRLPAAYDDGVEALMWVRDHALSESWLRDYGDLSNCYLMGCSAGGNIAYHCGLRAVDVAHDLAPLRITGLILNQPYFSGVEKTESEKRSGEDQILPLGTNYALWELSLPLGADRDHEYCNPVKTIHEKAKDVARYMVKDCVGDPLYDRARAFAEALEREGASVVALFDEEGFHGIDFYQPEKAEALVGQIRSFIYGSHYG